MSYPLRLPPELDAQAREQAQRLGISLNALIAVALDAYFRGQPPIATVKPEAKSAAPAKRPKQTKRTKPSEAGPDDERQDWRFFHPDPEMWPYVDPDFAHRFEGLDVDDDAACVALEMEYWSTRQRPGEQRPPALLPPSPRGAAKGGSVH